MMNDYFPQETILQEAPSIQQETAKQATLMGINYTEAPTMPTEDQMAQDETVDGGVYNANENSFMRVRKVEEDSNFYYQRYIEQLLMELEQSRQNEEKLGQRVLELENLIEKTPNYGLIDIEDEDMKGPLTDLN